MGVADIKYIRLMPCLFKTFSDAVSASIAAIAESPGWRNDGSAAADRSAPCLLLNPANIIESAEYWLADENLKPGAESEAILRKQDISASEPLETHTAAALIAAAWESFQAGGTPRHMDVIEHALWNGVFGNLRPDGRSSGKPDSEHRRAADIRRLPPGLAALALSLEPNSLSINIPTAAEVDIPLSNGDIGGVTLETNYPWDGKITARITSGGQFRLAFHIPYWCSRHTLKFNGAKTSAGITSLLCDWVPGDLVELDLQMKPRLAGLSARGGKCAISRGPLVYCLQSCDNPAGTAGIVPDMTAPFELVAARGLPDGAVALSGRRCGDSGNFIAIPYLMRRVRGCDDFTIGLG